MDSAFRFFVGIDWAWEEHTICIINREGKILKETVIPHSSAGIAQLRDLLGELEDAPASVAVAIETPRGSLVEALVEQQYAVFFLNPRQMDRFRDRHTMAGSKDDRFDALVLADSLRTDAVLFHRVRLDDAALLRLRELSRTEQEIHRDQRRTQNQLTALLNRYFPSLLKLCPGADEPWLWDVLEKTPLPQQAATWSKANLEKLLQKRRIRRFSAESLWQNLQTPPLPLAPGAADAASEHVCWLLPRLQILHQQSKQVAQRVEDLLEQMSKPSDPNKHRDAEILLSLPGLGRVTGATMLIEGGQALADQDYHALRSLAGTAPVTRRSGKSKYVLMRRCCNPRLRQGLYNYALCSIKEDQRSKQLYLHCERKDTAMPVRCAA